MKFSVTLAQLCKAGACYNGYNKLVRGIQGKPFTKEDEARNSYIRFAHKEPISLAFITENNGMDDALWATRCLNGCDRDLRLFAVWCARQAQHSLSDKRSLDALDVAERFANGEATQEELTAAWAAARAVAEAVADAAAWDAAEAVTDGAAWDAACAVTEGVASAAQKQRFIEMCNKGEF